ncbi:TPA: ead/Ea22-like family protein [Enterobacter roggenkampii]|uniref:ead/Ea22-like family protein n=1 Tax=Enterobacter roggenkampii TaxID=1812935 RepID=UPI0021070A9F|nr:ead/Ea22-like family protein [Enterobacter roggenkampii]
MSNIDKQELRADALEATGGSWVRESGEGWEAICCDDDQGNAGFIIAEFQGENATANRKFVQSANPATVLALLDELEAKDRKILKLEKLAEAESVGADKAATSCVEWMKRYHAAEKRIAELERKEQHSERQSVIDALAGSGEEWSDIEEYMQKWDAECASAAGKGE